MFSIVKLMEDVKIIAAYICQRYQSQFGRGIDEMKLHKLLYFCQREAIIQTGELLFGAEFEAWKYGPVLVEIRQLFHEETIQRLDVPESIHRYDAIFDKVFDTYAVKDSWSLSSLTHGETSWQKARVGYDPDAPCHVKLDVEDIRKDAHRIKLRRIVLGSMDLNQ